MATVIELTPADGDSEVQADAPVIARITDTSGIDIDLLELRIDSTTCTVANGLLDYWGQRTISGGVLVDDWRDIYVGTRYTWWVGSRQSVTIEVIYDGSTIGTATWTSTDLEPGWGGVGGVYETWYTSPAWAHGAAQGWYTVADAYVEGTDRVCYYYVEPIPDVTADGWYMVGHVAWTDGAGATTVGRLVPSDGAAAMAVHGYTRTDGTATVVVQGWMRTSVPAAAVVARSMRADSAAAMMTGRPTTTAGCAALIVYGTTARTHVEVRSITATTAAMLATLGVTRG